jgi:phage baseplate assembly protein V
LVRVSFGEDGVTTGWLQTLHHGTTGNSYFHTYKINELVAVMLQSDGVYGFVLGSVYSGDNTPTESGDEVVSIVFENGDKIVYDGQARTMTLEALNGVTINGDVTVTGSVDASVDVKAGPTNTSLTLHTHTTPTTGTVISTEITSTPVP